MKNYKIMECGLYLYHGSGMEIRLELSADGYNTCRSISFYYERTNVVKLMDVVGVDFENGKYLHELKGHAIRIDDSNNHIILYNLFDDNKCLEIN